jgi:hypothetical protein
MASKATPVSLVQDADGNIMVDAPDGATLMKDGTSDIDTMFVRVPPRCNASAQRFEHAAQVTTKQNQCFSIEGWLLGSLRTVQPLFRRSLRCAGHHLCLPGASALRLSKAKCKA